MADQWLRVSAPHFTAGIKFADDRCVDAAPILVWVLRKRLGREWFLHYCRQKRWTVEFLA